MVRTLLLTLHLLFCCNLFLTATDLTGSDFSDPIISENKKDEGKVPLKVTISASSSSLCPGQSAIITAKVTGQSNGIFKLLYLWSTPKGFITTVDDPSIPATEPGVYSVEVEESGADIIAISNKLTLKEKDISVSIKPENGIVCAGSPITLTSNVTGALPSSYSWTTPSGYTGAKNTSSITTSVPGDYVLTVFSGTCSASSNIASLSGPKFSVKSITKKNPSCSSESNGEISVSASGGSGSYKYVLMPNNIAKNGGANGVTFEGLPEGSYNVNISESLSSECIVKSQSQTLTAPSVSVNSISKIDVSCAGYADGKIIVSASGGSNNFTYKLQQTNATKTGSSSGVTFGDLPSGTYSVEVNDNNNSCKALSNSKSIQEPVVMFINTTKQDPVTVGGSEGSISVAMAGGVAPYHWSISGPVTKSSTSSNSTFNITGLKAGNYNITVDDANGCDVSTSTSLNSVNCSNFNVSISPTPVTAIGEKDGKAKVIIDNGSAPFEYELGPSSTNISGVSNTEPFDIKDLAVGNYSLSLSDSKGCEDIANFPIAPPDCTNFQPDIFENTSACYNEANGQIGIKNMMSGTPTFKIEWSGGGISDNISGVNSDDFIISGLPGGVSYTVRVTDIKGCTKTAEVFIKKYDPVSPSITGDLTICSATSSTTLSVTPAFASYQWSNGSTAPSITVGTGTYSVTVTNTNGCRGNTSATVTASPPININFQASNSNLEESCSGACDGNISLGVSGGTAPLSYSWTGPSGYTKTTKNINGLCGGNYSLTVTDAEGCTAVENYTITSAVSIDMSLSKSNPGCNNDDGSIDVEFSGGLAPFSLTWTNLTEGFTDLLSGLSGSSHSIVGLSAGLYKVELKDAKGCKIVDEIELEVPPFANATITPNLPEICKGESITLTAGGGTSFEWSNGATTKSITVSPTSNTEYAVYVESDFECRSSAVVTVKVNQGPELIMQITDNSGVANNDGKVCEGASVTLKANGATSYTWTGGNSNPLTVSPSPGTHTYAVTATNTEGCTTIQEVDVVVNEKPKAIIDFSDANQNVNAPQVFKNASISNCGTLVECNWKVEGSSEGDDCADISYLFDEKGTKDVTLEVFNSCGCSDEITSSIDIVPANECLIQTFIVNEGDKIACIGEEVSISSINLPSEGCNISTSWIKVYKNGNVIATLSGTADSYTFSSPGVYKLESYFKDDCNCDRIQSQEITIIESPDIKFADVNLSGGCVGETIKIFFDNYDEGDKVFVSGINGTVNIYETDHFNLLITEAGPQEIEIVSVKNGICESPISNQKLVINGFEPLQVELQAQVCNSVGDKYRLEIKFEGGDINKDVEVEGFSWFVINDEVIVIEDLDPNQDYNIEIKRGNVCESVALFFPAFSCSCTFEVGSVNPTVDYFVGCATEAFDVSEAFSISPSFNVNTDTAFYMLHSLENGDKLGKVVAVYPYDVNFITNDFAEFVTNETYFLSLVGIRKFKLFEFDFDDYSTFSFKDIDDCLSIIGGFPVIWHGSDVVISGPTSVCNNAYNEIFVGSGIDDGATIDIDVFGLDANNFSFDPAINRLYVHFVNEEFSQVPISITATTNHSDVLYGQEIETTCKSTGEYLVKLNQELRSPDTSNVIMWPGYIFASTDTTQGVCHRWGYTRNANGEEIEEILQDREGRFYFGERELVELLSERTQIWVETYYCDENSCATRNLFNGDFPIGGSIDDSPYGLNFYPNPGQGEYFLDIEGAFYGEVSYRIYDMYGRQFYEDNFTKNGIIAKKGINLSSIPNGMYFIEVFFNDQKLKTTKFSKI